MSEDYTNPSSVCYLIDETSFTPTYKVETSDPALVGVHPLVMTVTSEYDGMQAEETFTIEITNGVCQPGLTIPSNL